MYLPNNLKIEYLLEHLLSFIYISQLLHINSSPIRKFSPKDLHNSKKNSTFAADLQFIIDV